MINIRFYILVFSSILAGIIYFTADNVITLTQTYALVAVTYLYLALLASPVTKFFPFLPYRGLYLKARRALGVSAFLFALLHGYHAFFYEIGGLAGLGQLTGKTLLGVILGATSLFILFLLAATAFDSMVTKLTYPKWKMLHRLVYVVAVFTVIHATFLGSHFADISGTIPVIFYLAATILLILEGIRFYQYLKRM